MTDRWYIRWGFHSGRPNGILVTAADARELDRDAFLNGDVFVVPTDERVNGEIVYARIAPSEVTPA